MNMLIRIRIHLHDIMAIVSKVPIYTPPSLVAERTAEKDRHESDSVVGKRMSWSKRVANISL
uniref:Uncharacterized protein n=1 Tax=Heterorhabditis bacteriophora TaxID=37862 RepID=A0A1I7WHC4_HETBA